MNLSKRLLKNSSFSSASSLLAPTKFVALSLQIVRGLPLRLMNLLRAAMKDSVVWSRTTLK